MLAKKKLGFEVPPVDNPNAVEVAITNAARGVMKGPLEEKRAMRLAYYLQLAVTSVSRVNVEPEYEKNLYRRSTRMSAESQLERNMLILLCCRSAYGSVELLGRRLPSFTTSLAPLAFLRLG